MISIVSNMMFLITYLYRYDMISIVSNISMYLITYLYRYDIDCIEYDVFDNIFI